MLEVLDKEQFDKIQNEKDVSFLCSSTYGVANEMLGHKSLLFGIKEEKILDVFLTVSTKLKKSKFNKYVIYRENTDNYKKCLKKILRKNNGLFYTNISNEGNLLKEYYSLSLSNKLLEGFSNEIRTNINDSYKFPFEIIDIDKRKLDVFNLLFKNKLNLSVVSDNLDNKDFKFKMVILNIDEYISNLSAQKKELLLKIAEEKMNNSLNEINEMNDKIKVISDNIDFLEVIKSKKGNNLFLAAGIFFKYKDQFIEFKSAYDKDLIELKANYFLSFKMMKFAVENGCNEYFNMNKENIFDMKKIQIFDNDETVIRKFSYMNYDKKRRKERA